MVTKVNNGITALLPLHLPSKKTMERVANVTLPLLKLLGGAIQSVAVAATSTMDVHKVVKSRKYALITLVVSIVALKIFLPLIGSAVQDSYRIFEGLYKGQYVKSAQATAQLAASLSHLIVIFAIAKCIQGALELHRGYNEYSHKGHIAEGATKGIVANSQFYAALLLLKA